MLSSSLFVKNCRAMKEREMKLRRGMAKELPICPMETCMKVNITAGRGMARYASCDGHQPTN